MATVSYVTNSWNQRASSLATSWCTPPAGFSPGKKICAISRAGGAPDGKTPMLISPVEYVP